MYLAMEGGAHVAPQSGVSFAVRERAARVHVWLKATFNVEVPHAKSCPLPTDAGPNPGPDPDH